MFRNKLAKRIMSGLAAVAMTISNVLPFSDFTVSAADDAAHSINVFDIEIKQGATYYDIYDVSQTRSEDGVPELTADNGVYVWQAENSNEGHKFVYNIKVSLSGIGATDIETMLLSSDEGEQTKGKRTEEAVGAGFMKITVPRHILKFKTPDDETTGTIGGIYPDELEMPVLSWDKIYSQADNEIDPIKKKYYKTETRVQDDKPIEYKVYDPHTFVYYLDDNNTPDDESDDSYVIFNTQPISAGEVYEFPIAYTTTKNTWEYQDLGASNPCQAKLEVNSWQKEPENIAVSKPLTALTPEIPVYIDTSAEIKSTTKKIELTNGKAFLSKKELPSAAAAMVSEDNDAAYKYAIWSVSSEIKDVTQKYNLTLYDDTLKLDLVGTDVNGITHKARGEIVAINMGNGYNNNNTISNLTASGRRTDYVLVRYNNTAIDAEYDGIAAMDNITDNPPPAVYQTENTVTMTVTPADGQDKASPVTSTAIYKYEKKKPEYHPVLELYRVNKYGLYADGQKRVGNKNNVSSYELSKLTTEKYESISGIKYETNTSAYAYSRTVDHLNTTLDKMLVTKVTPTNGEAYYEVTAADRKYIFEPSTLHYTVYVYNDDTFTETSKTYEGNAVSYQSSEGIVDYIAPLDEDSVLRIAGQDIAKNYYGQKPLEYILDDKTIELIPDVMTPSENHQLLGTNDYAVNYVDYEYAFKNFTYDEENMEFKEGAKNANPLEEGNNILEFYTYVDGSKSPQLVAKYNVVEHTPTISNEDIVESVNNSRITFKENTKITGYQIKTTNKYYYIELVTKPSLTIYASDTIESVANNLLTDNDGENANVTEKKIGLENTATFEIKNNNETVNNFTIKGTDYIADIVKKSSISKKALGERTSYTGQDGNVYRSENDLMLGQYRLAWLTTISELADGVENADGSISNDVPVTQQSGIFYDLLPMHCDILEDSVNVYCDKGTSINEGTESLPPSSFKVLDRINNYNNSGRKLLVIEIYEPCIKNYTVTYCTIHAHEDIQDYGSTVLNTVAYQTGNPDIGDGFPDDGGNYAVTMSKYIKNLDPDNGNAKRFIYAEATEDILALFPTSSGIYKKVATASNPTYGKSGTVRSGEEYTYNIRMQNDSSTKAKDIAILDSVENYRTVDEIQYNKGINRNRDWTGTIQSFELSGLRNKVRNGLINTLTTNYLDNPEESWSTLNVNEMKAKAKEKATNEVDGNTTSEYYIDNVLKVIVYTGKDIVNLESESYSDSENRQYLLKKILGTPQEEANAELDAIAANWKTITLDYTTGKPTDDTDLSEVSAFIIHIGEEFELDKGGSVSFNVVMKAPETVDSASKYHYGDTIPETGKTQALIAHPMTYNNVYRSFRSSNTKNAQDKYTYFYTHYDYTQLSYTTVGDVSFSKVDSKDETQKLSGVQFSLSGISDYGKSYNETLISDVNGVVTFKNLERGRYTLIETKSDEDHVVDTKARTVEIDFYGNFMFVNVDGDTNLVAVPVFDKDGNRVYGGDDENKVPLYSYTLKNEPRYHGEFEFRKVNAAYANGTKGAEGTVFTFEGTSDYGTTYNYTEKSSYDGTVSFGDIETGTYTLTEITPGAGFMPPNYTKYTVKSVGTDNVTFTITANDSGNTLVGKDKSGNWTIENMPLAEFDILKVDSITLNPVDGAKFELTTTDSELIAELTNHADFYKGCGWDNTSGWKLTSQAMGVLGELSFDNIPVKSDRTAVYRLEEVTAPANHTKSTQNYIVNIVKNGNDRNFTVTVSGDGIDYVTKDSTIGYKDGAAETADFVRITNDPSYQSEKDLTKSWVGEVPENGNFPVLHLSSDEPEFELKKVQIDSKLKSNILTSGNKSSFTGNFMQTAKTDGMTNCTEASGSDDGAEIWMKFNSTTGDIEYYTNANVIYMPTNCESLFSGCSVATSINLSEFRFDNVTTMKQMFFNSKKVESILFPSDINTSNVTDMESVFQSCESLSSIDVSGFNTSNVTTMYQMFRYCSNLTSLDLSSFTGESLVSMCGMIRDCTKVTLVDLSGLTDTPLLTTTSEMFNSCTALTDLNMENWANAPKLTATQSMFKECYAIQNIEFKSLIAENMINMKQMFNNAKNLTYVYLGKKIAFQYKYNSNNVNDQNNNSNMMSTFEMWSAYTPSNDKDDLIIDLSGVDTSNVVNMNSLFNNLSSVKTIYVSDKWSTEKLEATGNLFSWNLKYLEGGNGTKCYNTENYSKDYACIDTSEHPGYFTDIAAKPTSQPKPPAQNRTINQAPLAQNAPASEPEPITVQKVVSVPLANADDTPTFPETYPNFTKTGDVEEKDAKAGTKDGTKFSYEYATADNVPITADNSVQVAETITLIVKKTQNGKTYTQKYNYTGASVYATWTKGEDGQWKCKFNVIDNTALMYAWEDSYTGYTCEQDIQHPITTQNEDANTQDESAIITNVKSDTEVGALEIEKTVTGLQENAEPDDKFEFTVTINKNDEDKTLYRRYTFKLKNGEKKKFPGIPAGYTYTVVETRDTGKYSYVSGEVTSETAIVKDTTAEVKITNKIERTSLTLSKTALLNKYYPNNETPVDLSADDSDLTEWQNREFNFNVEFTGLIPGETYTYTEGSNAKTFTSTTGVFNIQLKHNDSIKFDNLPVTASYTVTENETFENTKEGDYKDIYTVKIGGMVSDDKKAEGTLSSAETVAFTNLREIISPETVELSVQKEWYHEDKQVQWLTDDNGKPAKFVRDSEGNYTEDPDNGIYIPYTEDKGVKTYLDQTVSFPSFLSIYLGYGLYDPALNTGTKHQLLEQGTDTKQTLNVKNNWSYKYTNLPKYGTVVSYDASGNKVTRTLNYVYYITEIMPTGFELTDDLKNKEYSNKNPYYASDTSFYDSSAYANMDSVSNSQSIILKNQTVQTYKLMIGKLANGNFASRDKDFDFTINFVDSSGNALKNLVMTVEDLDGNIINPSRTITLEANGDYSAAIPHNTKLIFKNVPNGTIYTITDNETKSGYEVWYREFDFENGTLPTLSKTIPEGYTEGAEKIGEMTKDVGYLFINTLYGEVPTGIDLHSNDYIVVSILIIAAYIMLKRKKEYN